MAVFVGGLDGESFEGGFDNDTAYGNGGNDTLAGLAGADALEGGQGDDVLYGSYATGYYQTPYYYIPYVTPVLDRDNAVDILLGGDGNDVISAGYGDNVDGGDGEDKLFISFQGATEGVAFDLSLSSQTIGGGTIQNIEGANWIEGSEFNDVILGESLGWNGSAPVVFGMGGDDSLTAGYYTGALYGGDGNDSVDGRNSQYLQRVEGGAGNDTLYTNSNTFGVADGGEGNDLIYAHGQTSGGGGDDIIQMVWTYYSGAAHGDDGNDDLKAATDLAAVLYGDAGDDTLTGSGGNDYLDGGTDVDSALGGAGNDTYVVDNTYDVVAELLDEGTDTVRSSASFTIGAYIEALILTGSSAINGTGNSVENYLEGNESHNILTGLGGADTIIAGLGNDVLDGGSGADQLSGGMGNDVYVVDNFNDVAYEAVSEGEDTVKTNLSDYTLLGEIENLTLTGSANINGNGNGLNNTILGNAGKNILQGGAGDDILGGGIGADTLVGGDGSDTYVVDNVADVVTELLDAGLQDTIKTDLLNYVLIAGIENLTLTGSGNANATGNTSNNILTGNAGNNALVGGKGDDNLQGGSGDDVLNGGTGSDRMNGGLGNDTYWFGVGDRIDEPGDGGAVDGGIDTVMSTVRDYSLASNLEHLTLVGDGAVNGTGNAKNNIITGNGLNNILQGGDGHDSITGLAGVDTLAGGRGNDVMDAGDGNDVLFGGEGADLLTGGAGNDVFMYQKLQESPSAGRDTITDLSSTDIIDLSRIDANVHVAGNQAFAQVLAFTGHEAEMVLTYDAGTNQTLLTADANGDTIADFALIILGNHTDPTGWLL